MSIEPCFAMTVSCSVILISGPQQHWSISKWWHVAVTHRLQDTIYKWCRERYTFRKSMSRDAKTHIYINCKTDNSVGRSCSHACLPKSEAACALEANMEVLGVLQTNSPTVTTAIPVASSQTPGAMPPSISSTLYCSLVMTFVVTLEVLLICCFLYSTIADALVWSVLKYELRSFTTVAQCKYGIVIWDTARGSSALLSGVLENGATDIFSVRHVWETAHWVCNGDNFAECFNQIPLDWRGWHASNDSEWDLGCVYPFSTFDIFGSVPWKLEQAQ